MKIFHARMKLLINSYYAPLKKNILNEIKQKLQLTER